MRRMMILGLALCLAFGLSACGRRSMPTAPEDSTYPRAYPDITFPDGADKSRQGTDKSMWR